MPILDPTSAILAAATAFVVGCLVSPLLARCILFLAEDRSLAKAVGCLNCERAEAWFTSLAGGTCECGTRRPSWPRWLTLWTGGLFAAFVWLYLREHCQVTADVVPTRFWFYARFGYHLFLFTLLTLAIGTDLRNYTIADLLMIVGAVVGVGFATLSGDLQTVHIWVDWNQEVVGLHGPYRPDWLSDHPHLHGLAWSLTGAATGAGLTWILRITAQYVLQKPALGLGDVTLMGMVGSFTGWQPVILILLLAPLLAIVIGLAVWLTSRRAFIAYGPYLALATIVILCSWRWIWMTDLRFVFGHAESLLILAGAAGVTLVVLLVLLRLYEAIPTNAGE
jgi:leader peptidase (prepilin peptidase)/N-methyltransferase